MTTFIDTLKERHKEAQTRVAQEENKVSSATVSLRTAEKVLRQAQTELEQIEAAIAAAEKVK